jgi:hypothetical protein
VWGSSPGTDLKLVVHTVGIVVPPSGCRGADATISKPPAFACALQGVAYANQCTGLDLCRGCYSHTHHQLQPDLLMNSTDIRMCVAAAAGCAVRQPVHRPGPGPG